MRSPVIVTPFRELAANFVGAIQGRVKPSPVGNDGLRAVEAIEACYRSSRTGSRIKLLLDSLFAAVSRIDQNCMRDSPWVAGVTPARCHGWPVLSQHKRRPRACRPGRLVLEQAAVERKPEWGSPVYGSCKQWDDAEDVRGDETVTLAIVRSLALSAVLREVTPLTLAALRPLGTRYMTTPPISERSHPIFANAKSHPLPVPLAKITARTALAAQNGIRLSLNPASGLLA